MKREEETEDEYYDGNGKNEGCASSAVVWIVLLASAYILYNLFTNNN